MMQNYTNNLACGFHVLSQNVFYEPCTFMIESFYIIFVTKIKTRIVVSIICYTFAKLKDNYTAQYRQSLHTENYQKGKVSPQPENLNDMNLKTCIVTVVLLIFGTLHSLPQRRSAYTLQDGLSSVNINQIIQDYQGFIWVATDNGLNRFDGNKFAQYRTDNGDRHSLNSNKITALLEDSSHRLWVGTPTGLCRYNRDLDCLEHISATIPSGKFFTFHVQSILQTRRFGLLIATSGFGVFRLSAGGMLRPLLNWRNQMVFKYINYLQQDRAGNIYINVESRGLYVLPCNSISLRPVYLHKSDENDKLNLIFQNAKLSVLASIGNKIYTIDAQAGFKLHEVFAGRVHEPLMSQSCINHENWLITAQMRLLSVNSRGELKTPNVNAYPFFSNNKVNYVFEDKSQNIWCVTDRELVVLYPQSQAFWHYTLNDDKALCAMTTGKELLVGTTNGLYVYPLHDGNNGKEISSTSCLLQGSNVYDIRQVSPNGDIWIATDNGIYAMSGGGGHAVRSLNVDFSKKLGISDNIIFNITANSEKALWFGLCGHGVCRMDAKTGAFQRYGDTGGSSQSTNRLCNNWVLSAVEYSPDCLWFGTANGISEFDVSKKVFHNYFSSTNDRPGLLIEDILKVDNKIWIGTSTGIFIYDNYRKQWSQLTANGFPASPIKVLSRDRQGNVWAASLNKIYQINPVTRRWTVFTEEDGMPFIGFSRGCVCTEGNGHIFMGGTNGIVEFDPLRLRKKRNAERLVFTDLMLFNKIVRPGERRGSHVIISRAINEGGKIVIAYNDCFMTIGFQQLNYSHSSNTQYSYMLEGNDEGWNTVPAESERKATYTNLSPGTYYFKVRATSCGMVQQRQIEVVILPPWWNTWWMDTVYILLLIAVAFASVKYFIRKNQKKLEDMRMTHLVQMSQMKLDFFVNISHEIRTPLTLIVSPMEKLYKSSTGKERQVFEVMYRNTQRLMSLVNQLLDSHRIDEGRFTLHVERIDLKPFVQRVIKDFSIYAQDKNIHINMSCTCRRMFAFVDVDNFEKIIDNLLFNALKYSPSGQNIEVVLDWTKEPVPTFRIEVKDRGAGIKNDMLKSIFDRFVQASQANKDMPQGFGLGLHLCNQLTRLHHGRIWAENRDDGAGAKFCVEIPMGKKHFEHDNNVVISWHQKNAQQEEEQELESEERALLPIKETAELDKKRKAPVILVAEDDDEIRKYIKGELESSGYQILDCDNGEDALKIILTTVPDLVLCDIMMPGIDGITICKKIRANFNISYIPFILLTAKVNIESVQDGLNAGADEYITKPFSIDILKLKIHNLIEMRKELRVRYEEKRKFETVEFNNVSYDEKLAARIAAVMKKYMSDPDLSVSLLSTEVGLSRGHLNRKMKELFNMSPRDYIKATRLKQAAILLEEGKMNVSEIAEAVGFYNHSQFSSLFKQFYGIPPTDYVNSRKSTE